MFTWLHIYAASSFVIRHSIHSHHIVLRKNHREVLARSQQRSAKTGDQASRSPRVADSRRHVV
jgi:hypothetical protein